MPEMRGQQWSQYFVLGNLYKNTEKIRRKLCMLFIDIDQTYDKVSKDIWNGYK